MARKKEGITLTGQRFEVDLSSTRTRADIRDLKTGIHFSAIKLPGIQELAALLNEIRTGGPGAMPDRFDAVLSGTGYLDIRDRHIGKRLTDMKVDDLAELSLLLDDVQETMRLE